MLKNKDLLERLYDIKIFSKSDLKSDFQRVQIVEKDRYKTLFTILFGYYEWMLFELKNGPPEF